VTVRNGNCTLTRTVAVNSLWPAAAPTATPASLCAGGTRTVQLRAGADLAALERRIGNTTSVVIPDRPLGGAPSRAESAATLSGLPTALPAGTAMAVTVNISHTFASDLIIWLEGPDGTRVELSSSNGGFLQPNYTNTVFADDAATSITAASPPFTGRFRPEQPLSGFVGKNPNGTWKLIVTDNAHNFNSGQILNWSMTLLNVRYQWTGPNGFTSALAEPTASINANQPGTHTFNVSVVNNLTPGSCTNPPRPVR
jgi:subtilisin-like proprotein convertase family protein